jgi:predicted metal-binding protein
MSDKSQELESLFRELGYSDFKWLDPQAIVVSQWVRMKCRFGCDEFGNNSVFISGYRKAFLLYLDSCHICHNCSGDKKPCKHPKEARPTPEALGVDVFATVRPLGYPIEVLSDFDQTMNRYAFLLIE